MKVNDQSIDELRIPDDTKIFKKPNPRLFGIENETGNNLSRNQSPAKSFLPAATVNTNHTQKRAVRIYENPMLVRQCSPRLTLNEPRDISP